MGAKYEPYLDGLGSRHDLNYLFDEMLGELSLGHVYVARRRPAASCRAGKGGLARRRLHVENGRYRFARSTAARTGTPTCGRR